MLEFVLRLDLERILMEKEFSMNKMYGLQKKKNLYFALPIKYAKTCVYDNLIDMYEFVRFEK